MTPPRSPYALPPSVCAIERPDGLAFEQVREVDDDLHEAALRIVRSVDIYPASGT